MSGFDQLVAAVTGGASGIGLAISRRLAEVGAKVAVLDVDPATGSEPMVSFRCDVTDDSSVRTAIDRVAAEFGRLDIVVNNAGIGAQGTVADNDDAEWFRVLDVNVLGMVRVSRAALPHLRQSPSPVIVNVCQK
jgi:NAD(P)-dependent dehydrogenase (short-subunit alcohol dehydrogenase family)